MDNPGHDGTGNLADCRDAEILAVQEMIPEAAKYCFLI